MLPLQMDKINQKFLVQWTAMNAIFGGQPGVHLETSVETNIYRAMQALIKNRGKNHNKLHLQAQLADNILTIKK